MNLHSLVEALCEPEHGVRRHGGRCAGAVLMPSRDSIVNLTNDLRSLVFPGYFGNAELDEESLRYHLGSTLDQVRRHLTEQVKRGLCFACSSPSLMSGCGDKASAITDRFLEKLPEIQRLALGDVEAAYEGDPALAHPDEAIYCYPGLRALLHYRMAHELHQLQVPLLPRMMTEHAHSRTGIDIHPGAQIGERLFIDHGTGVVIGETAIIGNRVRLYQGVTLGAKSFPLDEDGNPVKGVPRHPILEDSVVIYSGATVLGRITVGAGSVIGGNVWLTRSVPPGSRVTQAQGLTRGFQDGAGI